ncbi:twin-arginine translocase subunit TatC, partial [Xenorhabdus bovienii]
YILVGAFVVGMLLTPPDVFSQTLLAIPMYLLFELGILLSQFYIGKSGKCKSVNLDDEPEHDISDDLKK